MAAITKLTVTNAKQIDATNWATIADVFGPQSISSAFPRGDCIVQATTNPRNDASEWGQIRWKGGKSVPGHPNQCLLERNRSEKRVVDAIIGTDKKQIAVWVIWAEVEILVKGPRPPSAVPWSKGAFFPGPDQCGAFIVGSMSMGENARGQIVAAAEITPAGVGKLLDRAKKHNVWKLRRQLTAHDFVDGNQYKHKKSFVPWVADDSPANMLVLNPVSNDKLFDTDGPDLTSALETSETYNNFRQWVEWDGNPCSDYSYWHFMARWKQQKVTLKKVDKGTMPLPLQPHYKKSKKP